MTGPPSRRLPRIVLISDYPPDHVTFTGGVQTAMAALLEGLRGHQAEFDFHLVSTTKLRAGDYHERRDGVWFHFLGVGYPRLPTRFPLRIFKVARELRRIRPDLVHCQANLAGALAAILGNYPRVMTIHGIGRHELPLRTHVPVWRRWTIALLEQWVFQYFGPIICISEYARGLVGCRSPTFAIPNAVGASFFAVQRRARHDPPRLVFAGLLAPLKRPADLVAAHIALRQDYPTLETLFVGPTDDAAYAAELRRTVLGSGVDGIEFLGRRGREDMPRLLSQATALVLPSAQENAPMVVAEAMAAGVPVVATRVGGVGEMVLPGQTGFLYEPGDIGALTLCLRTVLGDPELGCRLGLRARVRAQATYEPRRVAEKTVGAYRQLIAR